MCHLVDIYSSYFQADCGPMCCMQMISSGLPLELLPMEDRALNTQLMEAMGIQHLHGRAKDGIIISFIYLVLFYFPYYQTNICIKQSINM